MAQRLCSPGFDGEEESCHGGCVVQHVLFDQHTQAFKNQNDPADFRLSNLILSYIYRTKDRITRFYSWMFLREAEKSRRG